MYHVNDIDHNHYLTASLVLAGGAHRRPDREDGDGGGGQQEGVREGPPLDTRGGPPCARTQDPLAKEAAHATCG
jgi:hypothetical protein